MQPKGASWKILPLQDIGDQEDSKSNDELDFYLDYDSSTKQPKQHGKWTTKQGAVQNRHGAEVTAMSGATWKALCMAPPLHETKQVLGGPDRKPLSVIGEAKVSLSCKQKACDQTVYVIRNLKNNLLGLPANEHWGSYSR